MLRLRSATEVEVKVKVEPAWLTNPCEVLDHFSQSDRVEIEGEEDEIEVESGVMTDVDFTVEPLS